MARIPRRLRDGLAVSALLLDLDGTLVDTSRAVERAWGWAADELGVPFSRVRPYIHGIPVEQALAEAVPEVGPEERARLGEGVLERVAADDAPVDVIDGAADLLAGLPDGGWAIVTSGDLRMASATLRKTGLRRPEVLVTSDDVAVGKPHPDPYLRAAQALGRAAGDCLVVEDSPAGVASGRAAGMPVVAVTTTFPAERLRDADWVLPGLRSLAVRMAAGGMVVSVDDDEGDGVG